jgi:hypothetical protein
MYERLLDKNRHPTKREIYETVGGDRVEFLRNWSNSLIPTMIFV